MISAKTKKRLESSGGVPERLVGELAQVGFADVELLSANPRKGRWVLKARFENEPCLVKWNQSDGRYGRYFDSLQKEGLLSYALSPLEIVPPFVETPVGVCSRFIEGARTMRDACLADNVSSERLFSLTVRALRKWAELVASLNGVSFPGVASERSGRGLFLKYISSLAASGPAGTKGRRVRRRFNKLACDCLALRCGDMFDGEETAVQGRLCNMHGDFHLNNVLVRDDQEVYLVDLEDVALGLPEVELAYFYSQEWALSAGRFTEKDFDIAMAKAGVFDLVDIALPLLRQCQALMRAPVSSNSRFAGKVSCCALHPAQAWRLAFLAANSPARFGNTIFADANAR